MRLTPRCRVVIDNDWAGDPDGLVALAHHLLSPSNHVVAITSSFLSPIFGPNQGGAQRGAEMAAELCRLIGTPSELMAVPGVDEPFRDDVRAKSPAVDAIVAAAMAQDPLPLIVVCGGPLTNVAEALTAAPEIASRFTLCWIGGALDPDIGEYNRDTDLQAMNSVFLNEDLDITQFPLEAYRSCATSMAELEAGLRDSGLVGEWLWERFVTLPIPDHVSIDPVWPLGDSLPLLVTALNVNSSNWQVTSTTPRRVTFMGVDTRLLVGDLWGRLKLHNRERTG